LAGKLAERLELSGRFRDIDAVADAWFERSPDAREVERALEELLRHEQTLSPVLSELVKICEFKLFLTTDYTTLLEDAIQRHTPNVDVRSLAFTLRRKFDDLESYPTDHRCVYHLLGSFESHSRIALARVDQLEFFYELQTERGPRSLLGVLGEKRNLLFLGCDFPDWLAGFFTRTLIGRPLYDTRERGIEVIASERTNESNPSLLTAFLRQHRVDVYDGDATSFVRELLQRYRPPAAKSGASVHGASPRERSAGCAFISYASSELNHVRAFVENLRNHRVEVWFDEHSLVPGDHFEGEIRLAIQEESSAFIPVLTRATFEREQSYFIKEWRWAEQASQERWPGNKFVFPVILDDLSQDDGIELLRERFPEFAGIQVIRCPNGRITDDRLVQELKLARKRFERDARRSA
jgi:hypothetical protein